jgi:hypothetical protein
MEEKRVLCASCDISCSVVAQVEDGRVVKIRASDNPAFRDNLCMKGIHAWIGATSGSFQRPITICKPPRGDRVEGGSCPPSSGENKRVARRRARLAGRGLRRGSTRPLPRHRGVRGDVFTPRRLARRRARAPRNRARCRSARAKQLA